jgi:hypothetical protein
MRSRRSCARSDHLVEHVDRRLDAGVRLDDDEFVDVVRERVHPRRLLTNPGHDLRLYDDVDVRPEPLFSAMQGVAITGMRTTATGRRGSR